MSEVPEFADDSSIQELANDDPLSNSPVKGAIKWNQRDNRYDFVWWQTPFWIAIENGGYSMTKEFLDQLPGHLEHIWVVDENTETFKRFAREQYEEEGTVVSPDDPRFENVTPNEQVAVDKEKARETYDLSDVEL